MIIYLYIHYDEVSYCLSKKLITSLKGQSVFLFVCNVQARTTCGAELSRSEFDSCLSVYLSVCLSVKKNKHFSRKFLLNPPKPHLALTEPFGLAYQ